MNRLGLQALLRTVSHSTASDGDLLGRYQRERDQESFRFLVERYGRLVWSVCRHLTRSDADADDAFQATFLVLSQKAGSIRKAESLGSWLYGVATRICTKSRKAADRRAKREQAVSRGESHSGESPSKWDRALAAVHEELGKLPETLRVPFVMCCLEGKGTSEAAEAMGWKLGTFSGRLTRAKDLLIARLDARGLTAGCIASTLIGFGAINAPASVVAKTIPLAFRAAVIPRTILFLSQGVVEMNLHRVKLLAAGVILACSLGSGAGTIMMANAQGPARTQSETVITDDGRVVPKNQQRERSATTLTDDGRVLEQRNRERERERDRDRDREVSMNASSKWEYRFDRKPVGYAPTVERFQQTLKTAEKDGWEFVGQLNTAGESPDQPVLPTLVFRRPNPAVDKSKERKEDPFRKVSDRDALLLDRYEQMADRDARIAQLEVELATLRSTLPRKMSIQYLQKDLPLGASELKDILERVVQKVGLKPLQFELKQDEGGSIRISGDESSVNWAKRLVDSLSGKVARSQEIPTRR
ncbi:MAG: sigma-70 family RNA polymerase sigma factor [Gemmataceae bacterium]